VSVGIGSIGRVAALMLRVARGSHPPEGRAVREDRDLSSPAGLACDGYAPPGPPRAVVVAVHGATVNGKDDHRLQHFAWSLARSGVLCLVPTLPGLSRFEWNPSDVDLLGAFVRAASADAGRPVALCGFSYGGSYSLIAAAAPDVAPSVRAVVAFGPYGSFDRVFDRYFVTRNDLPRSDDDWDNKVYLAAFAAWKRGAEAGLPAETVEASLDLLRRYCDLPGTAEKRRFFEDRLAGADLIALVHAHLDREALAALSPEARVAGLRCPVSIVHDRSDSLVVPWESASLFACLPPPPAGTRHRRVRTSLLSHVSLSGAVDLPGVARLLTALVPLVEE
jgi:hypothetical protein